MNDKKWLTKKQTNPEPWEQGVYQTGQTSPPKRYGGIIAVLLAAVIFLGGIASAMGLLNIHLFKRISSQSGGTPPVSFFTNEIIASTDTNTEAETLPVPTGNVTLQINQSPVSVENIPQNGGLSLQEIYQRVIPSVVSIVCTGSNGSTGGSGVVLSVQGYIVTNCHVVEGAGSIRVQFTNGQVMDGTLVGRDTISDLAVLHVEAEDLIPAEFGDSDALRVGDAVAAIGDPLGAQLRGTLTNGIVSAINQDVITGGRTITLIQTNATLSAGNAGGPLLNCYGQVIGINTMKIGDYVSDAGAKGLGFAMPSTAVKEIVDQLIRQGYVSGWPTMGIAGREVSMLYHLYYHLPQGIYITEVEPNSDSAAKGISPGDILLNFDGVRITESDTLKSLLYSHSVGDVVEVVIYRGGKQISLALTIDEAQ